MHNVPNLQDRIRVFVLEKYPLARKRAVKDTDSLLESGVIDSMGVLELVEFLEDEFRVQVSDDELTPQNFQSIEQLASFVSMKTREASKPAVQARPMLGN